MADLISREAAIARITALIKRITPIEESRDMFFHDSGINGAITGAALEVKKLPAVDAVEAVRCKDCKHYYLDEEFEEYGCECCYGLTQPDPMDFCSYGERREEDAGDRC